MRQKFHIGDASLLRSGTYRSSDWMKQIFSQSEALPRCGLAYEQALRGALVTWWEKEGGLATSSLEFEYLHRKSQAKCWLAEMTLVMTLLPLALFNVCLHPHSFPLCAYWWKSDSLVDGEPQGNWRWNLNSRDVVASSPSFSRPAVRVPQRACLQVRCG